ncbi:MFS transporter [Streptomyces sp. BYX5S]
MGGDARDAGAQPPMEEAESHGRNPPRRPASKPAAARPPALVGSTQVAARLLHRVPPRTLMVPGLVVGAGGLAIIAQVGTEPAYASHVLPGMLLLGLGMGTAMMTSVSLATGSVAPQDAGAASATFNTAQQVGGSIGTALLNTIAATVTARYLTAHATPGADRRELAARATVHGFNVATWWAVGSVLLAAVVAAVVVNAPRPVGPGEAAPESGTATAKAVEN